MRQLDYMAPYEKDIFLVIFFIIKCLLIFLMVLIVLPAKEPLTYGFESLKLNITKK